MVDKLGRVILAVVSAIVFIIIAMYVGGYVPWKAPFSSLSVVERISAFSVVLLAISAIAFLLAALGGAHNEGRGKFASEEKLVVGETYTVVWRGPEIVRGGGGGGGRCECHVVVRLGREEGKGEYISVICSKTPPDVFVKTRNKDKPFAAVTVT
ncbi:MAG: hypothetical protein Athens071426_506 [Parcubacteria group bacterium Athens0714_26]|nr:MAG: hypothetical protein Athens101426_574 [Parcubacteria group bacterium Athens1014_26]TSD02381.1 MAG: hypothetical protein Athens071426_506 [Parcubacteria group bacterium Athens0714_26]